MITARSLVFYIRAEDQASRVVKNVAKNFGSLGKIRSIQQAIPQQAIKNAKAYANAQQQIERNANAIANAEIRASKLGRYVSRGKPLSGYTINETSAMYDSAIHKLEILNRQQELLAANLDDVARSAAAASAALDLELSQAKIGRVQQLITGFQGVLRAARLVGIGVAAALGFAAHSAAQFQTQLTLAATQARPVGASANATTGITQKLQGVVLKQMQQFPASSQAMADSLYQIFSSTNVQNIGEAGKLLATFNKAAVAGGTDLGTMTNASITLFNNFVGAGKEFSNITQALNVFFAAVRYGRTNAEQFAGSLSNVIGIAAEAGLKFTDVANAMAILTRQTGANTTSRDATGLARLIQELGQSNTIAGLKAIGVNEIDPVTNKLKPLLDIITQIQQKANLKGVNALNFFKTITALGGSSAGNKGTIQAQRAFAFLVNNIQQYHKVSKDVTNDNNEFQRSFDALSKSPGVKWAVLVNQFKALSIIIGTDALPAIEKMGASFTRLLKWFNGLSNGTKQTITTIATYGSVALVAGSSIGIFAGSIGKLLYSLRLLNLSKLTSETGELNLKFALMLGVVAALGYVLIEYPHQVEAVIKSFGGLKSVIISIVAAVAAFQILKFVSGLRLAGDAAAVAAVKSEGLLAALTKLKYLGPIAIVIGISEILTNRSKIQKSVGNFLDQNGLGFMGGTKETTQTIPQIRNDLRNGGVIGNFARDFVKSLQGKAKSGDKQAAALLTQIYGKTNSALTETVPKVPNNIAQRVASLTKSINLSKITGPLKQVIASIKAGLALAATDVNWNKLFNNVIKLDKLSKSKPTIQNFQALLTAEDALQKASTGNQYQAAQEMLSQLESTWAKAESATAKHAKKIADEQAKLRKKNIANAKTEVNDLLTSVQSMYDNFLSQNQTNFGTLFSGPFISGARVQNELSFGGHVTGTDVLKDLKAQLFQYNRFNKDVAALHKRGAPKSLIDSLEQMGPAGKANIKALNQLNPAQWKEYVSTWSKSQKAIKDTTITQLNSQLKIYESHGKKIALAIIKGIRSENVQLSNVLRNTVLKLFPGLAHQAKLSGGSSHTHYHIESKGGNEITTLKHLDFSLRNSLFPF